VSARALDNVPQNYEELLALSGVLLQCVVHCVAVCVVCCSVLECVGSVQCAVGVYGNIIVSFLRFLVY